MASSDFTGLTANAGMTSQAPSWTYNKPSFSSASYDAPAPSWVMEEKIARLRQGLIELMQTLMTEIPELILVQDSALLKAYRAALEALK